MQTQIDVMLNVSAIDGAGRNTTISAIRKLSKMSHGRCSRLLSDLEAKGLIYQSTRMYHGTIETKEYNLTPYGGEVVTALKVAQAMNAPF